MRKVKKIEVQVLRCDGYKILSVEIDKQYLRQVVEGMAKAFGNSEYSVYIVGKRGKMHRFDRLREPHEYKNSYDSMFILDYAYIEKLMKGGKN